MELATTVLEPLPRTPAVSCAVDLFPTIVQLRTSESPYRRSAPPPELPVVWLSKNKQFVTSTWLSGCKPKKDNPPPPPPCDVSPNAVLCRKEQREKLGEYEDVRSW